LGLLVARNVTLNQGKRTDLSEQKPVHCGQVSKVSGAEFAKRAGVSKQTVSLYLAAWNLAAHDEHCPPGHKLTPESEPLDIDEDDEHTRELWSKYLQAAREPKKKQQPKSGSARRAPGVGALAS